MLFKEVADKKETSIESSVTAARIDKRRTSFIAHGSLDLEEGVDIRGEG